MDITYYGHACFLIEIGGVNVLFDPFIAGNELASDVKVADIKADYILISHGHEDHVADAKQIALNNDATIISNYEIVSWFADQGVAKGHPMNHGGSWMFDFGKVKYVHAVHSSTLPDGSNGGTPGGFVVESNEGSFYYAGDTALTYDMKLLASSHDLDFAILPIGDNFTMGYQDAAVAANFIGCKDIIGMHYDTFGSIKIDHNKANNAFSDAGAKLTLMDIGQTISK